MSKFFKVNVSAVIVKDNEILIQKRSENEEVYPGLWGIPGGTAEMTDKNLMAALKREVKEEVGVDIDIVGLLSENIVAKEMYGVVYLVYVALYVSGEVKPLDGTSEVLWVSDIEPFVFTPTTKEAIKSVWNALSPLRV